MKPPESIETDRLILRKPRMEDAPALLNGWARHPEMTRFPTWQPHQSIEHSEILLKRSIANWDGNENFRYLLEIRASGLLAGMIELRLEPYKMSFGYTGALAQWGKVFMTEAARAAIRWAFEQPPIFRVFSKTDVDNIPSQRVFEKAGLQRDRVLRGKASIPISAPIRGIITCIPMPRMKIRSLVLTSRHALVFFLRGKGRLRAILTIRRLHN
jgi:ribosomal-protein-alanine N-acetyltransferase